MNIEEELINDCINGDRKAQHQLYKITYPYLMSICARYTQNEDRAKESLNLGFFKILKNLSGYRRNEPFKPWIRRIIINTLINEYKKEKAHRLNLIYVEDYHDSGKYAELNTIIEKINAEEIYEFIAALPPASRQVFNLYFIDGYKHYEIAEMLDISEGTSKWHLNSAREKLKEVILKNIQKKELINETK